MKPYGFGQVEFTEYPDVGDINTEARASHVGSRNHNRNVSAKAAIRRTQKRLARAAAKKEITAENF